MKRFGIFNVLFVLLIAFILVNHNVIARDFNPDNYEVYLPEGIKSYVPRPVIIGFSPSGRGVEIINMWQEAADEFNCIIIASNVVKNGMDIRNELNNITEDLNNHFAKEYPIDLNKVIAVGSSGGGMSSHMFSFFHPDTVAAVITNVGYIHESTLKGENRKRYPQNKVCAFVAGTTDYNYKLMKEDISFLQKRGWSCKWIEFIGGHVWAPQETRKEALEFVLEELEKKEPAKVKF